jgi:hypothetical protein
MTFGSNIVLLRGSVRRGQSAWVPECPGESETLHLRMDAGSMRFEDVSPLEGDNC